MGLSGKRPHNSSNKGVRFADKIYLDSKKIANKFVHQCTPPPIRLAGDMSKRQLKHLFHHLPLTGMSLTPADANEAIRLAKSSTAIRQYGMSTLHLKKLAHVAISYLTSIFNLSISTGTMWHKAIIIPIQKPRKDDNIGENFCPICLLCPSPKALLKLLPKILTRIPFYRAQHGFQTKHSACTALSTIIANIASGFSRKSWLTEQCSLRSI